MTVHNLYKYHTTLAALKLLKFRTPISLYSCFNISNRKETLLITPKPSTSFFSQSTSLWNVIRDILYIKDFSIKLSKVKRQLKSLIVQRQKLGDQEEWADENFRLRQFAHQFCYIIESCFVFGCPLQYSTTYLLRTSLLQAGI